MQDLRLKRCRHPQSHARDVQRWVQVNQKKNRPPLILLEATRTCDACGNEIHRHWYTEDQCQKNGIPTPQPVS